MDFKELAAFGTGVQHMGTPIRRKRRYMDWWQNEEAVTAIRRTKQQTATKLPRPLRLLARLSFV